MKHLVIIAAVVLICQSAKVPQDVTPQVSVAVTSNTKTETHAQVVEVAKTQKPITEAEKRIMQKTEKIGIPVEPTVQSGDKMGMPVAVKVTTVPQIDNKAVIMPTVQTVMKPVMASVVEMTRKTRAVVTTVAPEPKTVKPSVEVSPANVKTVITSTMQPETKIVMPTVTEMIRKSRAVMTTVQPIVKTVTRTVSVDATSAVMNKKQMEAKTVMPTVSDTQRKTRDVKTSMQNATKSDKPNTVQISTAAKNTIVMSKVQQPDSNIVVPTVPLDMKRKVRAVPVADNKPQKVYHVRHNNADTLKAIWAPKQRSSFNKMHSHRSMRSVQHTIATKEPVTTVAPVATVKENTMAKSSDPAAAKSTIDPCDLLCTKFEFEPICASNGLCVHEFPNQCILDTFNCKHANAKFTATKDGSCQMSWLTKCQESDMI